LILSIRCLSLGYSISQISTINIRVYFY